MQGREGCRWRRGRGSLTFLSPDYIFFLFLACGWEGKGVEKIFFFSRTIRGRVMKLGLYLYLGKGSLKQPSTLGHGLYFMLQ